MPPIRLIFQTIAFSEDLYFALPFMQINWTPDVFKGVGMRTSIFWANKEGLKFDLITTFTSNFVRPTSLTSGMTRNGKDMSLVVRYLKIIVKIFLHCGIEHHD